MNIADKLYVAFDYKLTLDSGQEVDRSSEGQPLGIITGSGQVIPGLEKGQIPEVMVEGVDQGTRVITHPWMHYQSRVLIDHQDMFILKHYIKRDVFGQDLGIPRWVGEYYGDYLFGLDFIVRLYGLLIDKNISCFCGSLDLAA